MISLIPQLGNSEVKDLLEAIQGDVGGANALDQAMGKNSNAHKSQDTHNLDMMRERELEAKRAAKRATREAKLGVEGDMEVVDEGSAKTKKFGKMKMGRKVKVALGGGKTAVTVLKPSLSGGKRGIRKPSQIMRKTLKKMAKRREMVSTHPSPPCVHSSRTVRQVPADRHTPRMTRTGNVRRRVAPTP